MNHQRELKIESIDRSTTTGILIEVEQHSPAVGGADEPLVAEQRREALVEREGAHVKSDGDGDEKAEQRKEDDDELPAIHLERFLQRDR